MTKTRWMRASGAALSAVLLLAAVSASMPATREILVMDFDDQPLGSVVTSPRVSGSASGSVNSSMLTRNGGKAITQAGTSGNGRSIRLPAYTRLTGSTPLAVVSIRNKAGSSDPLSPGAKRFAFSADFSLDNTSSNTPSNTDGDNVFQRGLSPNAQWQLSVDGRKAQCSVRPAARRSPVRTPAITIPRNTANRTWYRAVCVRDSDAAGTLTLTVSFYDNAADAWKFFRSSRARGAAGNLSMERTIPVSVGGKLNNNNTIQRGAPDQFNGLIDNVRLVIG